MATASELKSAMIITFPAGWISFTRCAASKVSIGPFPRSPITITGGVVSRTVRRSAAMSSHIRTSAFCLNASGNARLRSIFPSPTTIVVVSGIRRITLLGVEFACVVLNFLSYTTGQRTVVLLLVSISVLRILLKLSRLIHNLLTAGPCRKRNTGLYSFRSLEVPVASGIR